jgi:hypothetical protein
MKTSILMIVAATTLMVVGVLAVMNNACKSGTQHAWCAPMSSLQHHIKTGQG